MTPGADNVSDMFTKHVGRELLERHMLTLGFESVAGTGATDMYRNNTAMYCHVRNPAPRNRAEGECMSWHTCCGVH